MGNSKSKKGRKKSARNIELEPIEDREEPGGLETFTPFPWGDIVAWCSTTLPHVDRPLENFAVLTTHLDHALRDPDLLEFDVEDVFEGKFSFEGDFVTWAQVLLRDNNLLAQRRYELVPRVISETEFWRYFFCLIRQFVLHQVLKSDRQPKTPPCILRVTMDDDRANRNLVLSLCDMKQGGDVPPSCGATEMATVRTRIYLFGGADEGRSFNDLYMLEIEKSNWSLLKTTGLSRPSSRYGHSLSAFGDCLLVFGGMEPTEEESDNKTPSFAPPPFMPQDLTRGAPRLWCHRGVPTNSLYLFDTMKSEWSMPNVSGALPPPRSFHASALIQLPRCHKLLIWGGCHDSTFAKGSNDAYLLDLDSWIWTKIVTQTGDVPSPRYGHKMVFVPSVRSVFLFGGADDDGALYSLDVSCLIQSDTTTTTLLDTASPSSSVPVGLESSGGALVWTKMQCQGTPPLSRSFHSLNWVGNRLFIVSGLTVAAGFSDLYIYDITKNRWCRPLYDSDLNMIAHGSAVLHDKVLVYGGARTASLAEQPQRNSGGGSGVGAVKLSRRLCFLSVLEIKQSMNAGEYRFKLVAVGDSGVGKSCLLQRFAQDVYNENNVSTIGVDFRSVATMVQGRLWDTAGQERYSGVTGNYYRNADGFVVVYDATRRETFDHVLNWMRQIQDHHEFGPDTVKLLIGNKQDLVQQIVVSDLEGRTLADNIGAIYLATSARTGAGVDTAFLLAAKQLIEARRKPSTQSKASTGTSVSLESSQPESILQWASRCCMW